MWNTYVLYKREYFSHVFFVAEESTLRDWKKKKILSRWLNQPSIYLQKKTQNMCVSLREKVTQKMSVRCRLNDFLIIIRRANIIFTRWHTNIIDLILKYFIGIFIANGWGNHNFVAWYPICGCSNLGYTIG